MVHMSEEDFDNLVADALDLIPGELLDQIDNCVILVENEPPDGVDPDTFGLYEGTPLTERGEWWAGSLPDRILIFRGPTLRMCASHDDVVTEVRITVTHEIAHHFGIDDDRLDQLGWA